MDKQSLDNYITGHYGEDQFDNTTKVYSIGNPPFMTIDSPGQGAIPIVHYRNSDNKWLRSYIYRSRIEVARMLRFYRKQRGLVTRITDQRI